MPNIPSRFTLIGRNNRGVYLIRDKITTGTYCVEKHLKRRDVINDFARREIEILYQLRDHPNITNLIYFESERFELPSATMWTEYRDHGSLEDTVRHLWGFKEYVTEEFLWSVLEGLVRAVRYCQLGDGPDGGDGEWDVVYHLDIQPSDIFLSYDNGTKTGLPRVLLGDFGCSTSYADIAAGTSIARKSSGSIGISHHPKRLTLVSAQTSIRLD